MYELRILIILDGKKKLVVKRKRVIGFVFGLWVKNV